MQIWVITLQAIKLIETLLVCEGLNNMLCKNRPFCVFTYKLAYVLHRDVDVELLISVMAGLILKQKFMQFYNKSSNGCVK